MKERRCLFKNLKKSINDDISKIKIRIHRFRLSGPYLWSDLDGKIGKLKINEVYNASERMPNYKKNAFVRFKNRNLSVFLNPKEGTLPQCIIELSYPYQKLLSNLQSELPRLKVSFAEYTIDIFFENHKNVKKYFNLIYRYIYFRNQKEMVLHSNKELDDDSRKINAWVFTDKMKLYERGPDKKINKGGYWLLNDVDRIRIELKAKWRDLNSNGLNNLELFLKNPLFTSLLKNRFKFKRFKSSVNNVPSEYDDYYVKDSKGHSGAFQNQYLYLKDRKYVKNISQSIEDVPELLPLYYRILSKIDLREKKWLQKYEEINKDRIIKEKIIKKKTKWEVISLEEAMQMQKDLIANNYS